MKDILSEAVASPEASLALVNASMKLATGERWLSNEPTRTLRIITVAPPAGEWGEKVDGIEAPFAPQYDAEEYTNPGLQMLNLAELTMVTDALGVGSPLSSEISGQELAGKRMWEIGCGTGRIALLGAGLGAEITALDQTAEYVQAAAAKMNRLPITAPDPRLIVAPAEAVRSEKGADAVTAMFGVLNHCEDWKGVIGQLVDVLDDNGKLILSMYGSPEAAVYDELSNGLPYAPAILTRRAPGGLLLGEGADEILPATFPYPQEVVEQLESNGLKVEEVRPLLTITALYPRNPSEENINSFLGVVERRYGAEVSGYLRRYADNPATLLTASLSADCQMPSNQINDAAYFGVIATKGNQ